MTRSMATIIFTMHNSIYNTNCNRITQFKDNNYKTKNCVGLKVKVKFNEKHKYHKLKFLHE